jgi:hypothetical protein
MDGVVAGPAAVFYLDFWVFWGCRGLVALLLFLFARGWSGAAGTDPRRRRSKPQAPATSPTPITTTPSYKPSR